MALPTLQVRRAKPSDIPSLTTIFARAFHPVNAYMLKCMPDTPAVREWWARVFTEEIQDSVNCHVFVAIDSSAPSELQVVGVICLRQMEADYDGAGLWTMHEFTPDQSREMFQPACDAMIAARMECFAESGARHFNVELFGVDQRYAGKGLGRQLLESVGRVADEAGLETFVEANASAAGVYQKLGFEPRGSVRMPGENEYVEHMMLRPVKKT